MVTTPDLLIRLKRHTEGAVSLTCVRRDGSTTWQRLEGATAMVFPGHDLTHFAVETTLGFRQGFYGLLADGWEIQDFAKPWPRGPIPDEAREVELFVGFFDAERRQGEEWTADEFAGHADTFMDAARSRGKILPVLSRALTSHDLAQVRDARAKLLARWAATAPGDTLELVFEPSPARAPD